MTRRPDDIAICPAPGVKGITPDLAEANVTLPDRDFQALQAGAKVVCDVEARAQSLRKGAFVLVESESRIAPGVLALLVKKETDPRTEKGKEYWRVTIRMPGPARAARPRR